jgi:hypothetical protein
MVAGAITKNGKNLMLYRLIGTSKTVPSLFKVGTGTTDPTESDTDLETAVEITTGVYTKAFASGYPVLTEASKQLTIRCVLASTEANGNSLTEFGIFNTDGTPLMYSRDTHVAITKNSYVQVVYEQIDEMV